MGMITLINCEITSRLSQCMSSQSTNVTEGQTDGRTTHDSNNAF